MGVPEISENMLIMLGEIKGMITQALNRADKQDERIDSLDTRLMKVEKKIVYVSGGIAAIFGLIELYDKFLSNL